MQNSLDNIYSSRSKNDFMKFKDLKMLELINSEIFIFGLEIENNKTFESIINEENNSILSEENISLIQKLVFLTDIIIEVLNRTENFCRVNIIFVKVNTDTPLAFYENILAYFYSMVSIKAKLLENKKFVITFPQIFSKDFKEIMINENNDYSKFNYYQNFDSVIGIYISKFLRKLIVKKFYFN